MAENSKIEWCHHTHNPWRGCTRVSQECAKCYAETLSHRNPGTLGVWGPNGTRVFAAEATWREPLKWDRKAKDAGERHRVFCASLADVFEDWGGSVTGSNGNRLWWCHGSLSNSPLPSVGMEKGCRWATLDDVRSRLFDLIDETPNLDWLLLTKRPENIDRMMPEADSHMVSWAHAGPVPIRPNVWLGTSVGVRDTLWRIDHLRKVPAAVRFLSIEPLLEDLGTIDLTGINLVIVGGESGHGARPMHPDWARSIRDQCVKAGVAFFFKQWGEHQPIDGAYHHSDLTAANLGYGGWQSAMQRVGKKAAGRVLDGRVWDEMPLTPAKGA